jgi:murein DD-endopeptidase MepM/ murein hydrolase activator NlpD
MDAIAKSARNMSMVRVLGVGVLLALSGKADADYVECGLATVCVDGSCQQQQVCYVKSSPPTGGGGTPPGSGGGPGGAWGYQFDVNRDGKLDCWRSLTTLSAVSSPYGAAPNRPGDWHYGSDITSGDPNYGLGAPVRALANGVIQEAGNTIANGNYVKLNHDDGRASYYLHLQTINSWMVPGARVIPGMVLGYMNCTGNCYSGGQRGVVQGTHLHVEVRTSHTAARDSSRHSTTINPVTYAGSCS